jgi:antitoxin (DNA-binding transcriptional repressor) of toxin-antitoxin stability system
MITVGVRDLKNQLSQYLLQVKQGERVFITEHNRVIAELSLPQGQSSNTDIAAEMSKLAASGKLILAQRNESISPSTDTHIGVDWVSVYQDNRAD